jgi:hypothetical protein
VPAQTLLGTGQADGCTVSEQESAAAASTMRASVDSEWLSVLTLLIQNGASIVYVKEQVCHSSIQVTVDIYGHLIPGANVSFVDSLDQLPEESEKTTPQQNATQAQPPEGCESDIHAEVTDLIGGGGWTRTNDLRIMRTLAGSERL